MINKEMCKGIPKRLRNSQNFMHYFTTGGILAIEIEGTGYIEEEKYFLTSYEEQLLHEKFNFRKGLFNMAFPLLLHHEIDTTSIELSSKWEMLDRAIDKLNLVEIICLRYKISYESNKGETDLDILDNLFNKCINNENLVDKYKIISRIDDDDIDKYDYYCYYDEGWETFLYKNL